MAGGHDGFNGSRVTFPSTGLTIGKLRGIKYGRKSPQIDVTGSSMTGGIAESGLGIQTVTVDLVGASTTMPASGTKGALGITWKNTETLGTITSVVSLGYDITGSYNGEVTASVDFVASTTGT